MDDSVSSVADLEILPLNHDQEFENFELILQKNSDYNCLTDNKLCKEGSVSTDDDQYYDEKLLETIKSLGDSAHTIYTGRKNVDEMKKRKEQVENSIFDLDNLKVQTEQSIKEISERAEAKWQKTLQLTTQFKDKDNVLDAKEKKIRHELSTWKKVLGLELLSTSNHTTIFAFSNIDRDDPEQKYRCEIGLKDGRYICGHCQPSVPEFENLVQFLNKTNDLSGFLVAVRKKFISSVGK